MNVEDDRLSRLPDDLIYKVLSYIDIKQAIQTSALSSRWRYTWTSMPCLNFSSRDLSSSFVTCVLSSLNNQTDVQSVNLAFRGKASQVVAKRILKYAFSRNVQRLNIACMNGKCESLLPLFSSQSLKHLTLTGCTYGQIIIYPPAWELPNLTTANLHRVIFYNDDDTDKSVDLFSKCTNLKNLTLSKCRLAGLNICHSGLSNLTLEDGYNGVNVVTPQLKNLTINNWRGVNLISAPNLSSLRYKDSFYTLELSADLPHLEKADICIPYLSGDKENAHKIMPLLQRVCSVKFLTLNLEIIEFLSSSVEQISHQPSPFANLKSLKIYPVDVSDEQQTQPNVTMSTEVKNYLLDSSPSAIFTMVSHEEMRALINVAIAKKLMREFQVVLDQLKENCETNTTDIAQPDMELKWQFEERMARIESYWEDLNGRLGKRYKDVGRAILMLRRIEKVLTRLPTSHRDKLQARFAGLCVEADTIMVNIRSFEDPM